MLSILTCGHLTGVIPFVWGPVSEVLAGRVVERAVEAVSGAEGLDVAEH